MVMTKRIIFGLCHQWLFSLWLNNFDGIGRVKGSLVLGLFNPTSFLILFLRASRVRIYRKAAEPIEKSAPGSWL